MVYHNKIIPRRICGDRKKYYLKKKRQKIQLLFFRFCTYFDNLLLKKRLKSPLFLLDFRGAFVGYCYIAFLGKPARKERLRLVRDCFGLSCSTIFVRVFVFSST